MRKSTISFIFLSVIFRVIFPAINAYAADLHPAGVLSSGLYHSPDGNVITESGCTVEPGRNVTFAAQADVILTDGFLARYSSTFTARIADTEDTDLDGMADWWEALYGLDPAVDDAGLDPDLDGLTNLQEFQGITDPTRHEKPTASISADPSSILGGQSTTLNWNTTYADSAYLDPGGGSVAINGSIVVYPPVTTTYTLSVGGPGGLGTVSVTVPVTHPLPTVSIEADPGIIFEGDSSTLTWDSKYADSASIDHGIGSVPVSGTADVTPAATAYYIITVTGLGGTETAGVMVAVIHPPPTVNFSADPIAVHPGETVTLTWDTVQS